ncbi:ceramide synthase isoform X2 [Hyla sarda]|uniref:ceramide synthase isoform X2 n=1 Tax=Hyla sarda TaxID=327740 RepID=UPI0024C330D5|nr:ceramide synthase isoform X2 [Hyla sarda]
MGTEPRQEKAAEDYGGREWPNLLPRSQRSAACKPGGLVSSIQAVLASTAGYIVASSCRYDVIEDRHWLAATYTRFAVPYFIYDIYAMYLCYWHKHKLKGHPGGWALTKAYLRKEFLMVLHHVFMVAVCFPVSVLWREGKGGLLFGVHADGGAQYPICLSGESPHPV